MIINTRTFFIITLLFIGYLGTHVHANDVVTKQFHAISNDSGIVKHLNHK
jgi:hypothetical protein